MKTGASRIDITPTLARPLPLLGWGDPKHFGNRVSTPIFSRAVAFEDERGGRVFFTSVEICFISESIRLGVMRGLKERAPELLIQDHEVMLTATHTHNAPGGYCHSILYNIPSRGYHPEVYRTYVDGVVESILLAWERRVPSRISCGSGEIDPSKPVAFNRSIEAWNQNPDVVKRSFEERHLALDRTMDLLVARNLEGGVIVAITWFAVHCTSMHDDHDGIHSDNKGVAARMLEEALGGGAIALFAQGAAGDVSPNFRKFRWKQDVRGEFPEDEESCRFNAAIQVEMALELMAVAQPIGEDRVDSTLSWHDLTRLPIPSEWVGGRKTVFTAPAALGCPFLGGTAEGGGANPLVVFSIESVLRLLGALRLRKVRNSGQGNKVICVDLTEGRVFGDAKPENLPIPGMVDPLIRVMRFWSRIRLFKGEAMTPTVLPVALFRIGGWGFIAGPGEFTTQSGVRIRNLLSPILKTSGIRHLVFSGYANSYAGYITTDEEYQLQKYEGACTHFGRNTLLGYLAAFRQLAEDWTGAPRREYRVPAAKVPEAKSASYLRKLGVDFFLKRG